LNQNHRTNKTSDLALIRLKPLIQEILQLNHKNSNPETSDNRFEEIIIFHFVTLMFIGIENINELLKLELKDWNEVFSYFTDPCEIILQLNNFLSLLNQSDQVYGYYSENRDFLQENLRKVDWGRHAEMVCRDVVFKKNHRSQCEGSSTNINFDFLDKIAYLLIEIRNKSKKHSGIIYTPYYIAEQITEKIIIQWYKKNVHSNLKMRPNQKPVLLDPTVGTGIFLIAAGNVLLNNFKKEAQNSSDLSLRKEIIEHYLYGFDNDPIGILITKIKLNLWILDDLISSTESGVGLSDNIYQRDSLFEYSSMPSHMESISKLEQDSWNDKYSVSSEKKYVYKIPSKSSFHKRITDINKLNKIVSEIEDSYYFVIEGRKREWNEFKAFLSDETRKKVYFSVSDYYNPTNDSFLVSSCELHQKLADNLSPWNFHESSHRSELGLPQKFDIIVGNPPYIALTDLAMITRLKIRQEFPEIYNGNSDVSYFFTKKMIQNLNPNGILGFLLPKSLLSSVHAMSIREFISKNSTFLELHDFNGIQLFPQINIKTCFVLLKKQINSQTKEFYAYNYFTTKIEDIEVIRISQTRLKSNKWTLLSSLQLKIIEKLIKISNIRLKDISSISKGIETGCDKIFAPKIPYFFSKQLNLNSSNYKPWLKGKEIKPFFISREGREVLYAPKSRQKQIRKSKKAYQFLKDNQNELLNRSRVTKYYLWREGDERYTMNWQNSKIVTPYKAKKNTFAIDNQGCLSSKDVVWIIPNKEFQDDDYLQVLVALLNSKTLTFYARCMFKDLGNMFDYYPLQIDSFPLVMPLRNSREFINILNLVRRFRYEKRSKRENLLQDIDKMVYQLYNLTKEQILEVESFTSR
jgi:hypothetical protein